MKAKNYKEWYETKGRAYYRHRSSLARRTKLHVKITNFKRRSNDIDPNLTVENLKTKFGANPCCYLTGQSIDLTDTRSFVLDHIIPISRGGTSSLENCGLTIPAANKAKNDMTPQEFLDFCRRVIAHQEIP